ncbi:MAG: long-chain fatty acid--CoA ligase, partial [Alicyclobacillus sp.]|nr:long-chain fatty acid--CoA ligase [Alicyclobacillus sp.]
MMDVPLLLKSVLYRATTVFPEKEVISRTPAGLTRYTYCDLGRRVRQLANALAALGVQPGERVASFAWNHHRHLELYFAVPCSQRVLHTVNIRLFREQLAYTINHAEDQVVFVDEDLVPLLAAVAPALHTVRHYVVLTDRPALPADCPLPGAVSYEALLAEQSADYEFPEFAETTPAILGYTSATTGDPKGVVYTHRALYLHCLTCLTGEVGVRETDVTLTVVPMFHVNAWGRPFCDTWAGATQVYPGPRPSAADLCELIQQQRVTFSAAVPTIWTGILQHVRAHPEQYDFRHARCFLAGGAALPEALAQAFEEELGVPLYQGYGQTETTPVTLMNIPKAKHQQLQGAARYKQRAKTGLLVPGLEMRVVNAQGQEVQRDGRELGELWLRGPWVLQEYYKDPEQTRAAVVDGWFRTGDIVTVDPDGYVQVVDRTKDLIKSGGEWISSVDLENHLMSHPDVEEAAVIGIPDDKWQERPLACVV